MTDEEFRDLQERVALIKETASSVGWEMLVDRARAKLYMTQQRVINGRLKDFEEYKAECAFMDGLEWALTIPRMVEEEMRVEEAKRLEARVMERLEEDDEDELESADRP